jgi:polyphosphate kinase
VRLDVATDTPDEVRTRLTRLLDVDGRNVFRVDGLLGFEVLEEIANLPVPALRWSPHKPFAAESLSRSEEFFQTLRTGDVLSHQPFDSFHSVETMVSAAVSTLRSSASNRRSTASASAHRSSRHCSRRRRPASKSR